MRPLVSFVIPVKNDAPRLRRCLSSIVSNAYPRELIEMVVIDNHSSDGSGRVAREYGAVVLHSAGGSVAELRNRGARAALGPILAFADSDHEIDPDWIDIAVEVLSRRGIAATGAPWLGGGSMAIRRAAFQQVGGFNAALTACEDVDLRNRLLLAGHRIVADPRLRSVISLPCGARPS